MTLRRSNPALVLVAVAAIVAACSPSDGGAGWTLAPAPSSSAEPSASGSPAAGPSASASSSPDPSASATPAPSTGTSNGGYALVGTKDCPESRFECITLSVPRDHFAAVGGPTWDVTFAIQRAAKERKGTFVVITGGPGSSGIASADGYTDYYATEVTDAFDIVFMDQRGIGLSEPIQCIDAAAAYYASPSRIQVVSERAAAETAAQTFVTECMAEAGLTEADLPLYSTRQAIEDLEAIRDYLGVETLDLYGESYGTQFVQQYAAAHPERIAALYADGPVDLSIDGITYYIESTRGAEDTLVSTLAACTADDACRADVKGGDALAAFDALAETLSAGPIAFGFPKGDGTVDPRELTVADLENAAFYSIYSPGDRESLQRAIAAASTGNYVPLAKLSYGAIGVDPETLDAIDDPTWSDALYFAVECQDYAFYPTTGTVPARLDAWLAAGQDAGIDDLRLGTSFYGDIPCVYWPTARATDERPAALVDVPFPVFVLTSTTDPATPIVNGYRIYSRLDDAWFFQTIGGPHVIYGWGESCPDETIAAYLVDRTLPATRVTTCEGQVADDYVPNALASVDDADDALAFMWSMDDALFNTDEYQYRLDADALAGGCDFGGTVTYTPTDAGTALTLNDCAFTADYALTGSGEIDDEAGTFELEVTSGEDELRYERDGDGGTKVTGTFDGRRVSLEEPA